MGSAVSGLCSEAETNSVNLAPVHECLFPLHVMKATRKVSDFLEMEGVPEAHAMLKQRSLLHEWHSGMFVLFISHQWLSSSHPDPQGRQVAVLRDALQGMINGSVDVTVDFISRTHDARSMSQRTRQQIAKGYLFFDWFAIPQITARTEGINEESTRSDAASAVKSIPAYVEVSNMFIALVPEQLHKETGLLCNYASWLSRGWCRAELWCHLLSNKPDTSMVVVYSPAEAEYMFPLDWQHNLISEGDFTVESDRSTVVKLGDMAVMSKIQHLSDEGPLSHFRFYLALRPRLLGRERRDRTLEEFLLHFRFQGLQEAAEDESPMNGTLSAVMSGDVKMLRLLAANRADVNFKLCGLGELGYFDTQTVLMAAAKSRQEPEMLSALIELKADVETRSRSNIVCAYLVRSPGHVKVLADAKANLEASWPLNGPAALASTETVAAMLKFRCDPNYDYETFGVRYGPLHSMTLFGRSNRDAVTTAQLLLAHRANVNAQAKPQGAFAQKCRAAQLEVAAKGFEACPMQTRFEASAPGITPLSLAALMGHEDLVKVYLEFGAEMIPNARGDLPEDPAKRKRGVLGGVLTVSDFLRMSGPPEAHGHMKEKGWLRAWHPGMFVIFTSHQWLGSAHPDPQGQQCAVLRKALLGVISGSLQVQTDPVTLINRVSPVISAGLRQQIADGFLFFDWFAIPQITARLEGVNEDETRSDAALAVQSIPAYVEVSSLFIALVPELTHTVTGARCNYISWLSRGWCRAELWCHVLSNKLSTSLIVVHSAQEAEFMSPLDWQRHSIADGEFTVESDRSKVVQLGEIAVRAKIEYLSSAGPLSSYRFYLAGRVQLLRQKTHKYWERDAFLQQFRFPSLQAAAKDTSSMNGLLCATFAGDVNLIHNLVYMEADVNLRLHGLEHFGYFDGQTLLMAAAKSHQPARVLAALIELAADVNSAAPNGTNPAYMMRSPEQMHVLLNARADLHSPCLPLGLAPLTGVASFSSTETVAAMLQARCDPNPSLQGIGYGPLHGATFFSRSNRHAEGTVKLLLAHAADANARAKPQGNYSWICALARSQCAVAGFETSPFMSRAFASLPGLTPLAAAAFIGCQPVMQILLRHDAVAAANDRGDWPDTLATSNQHLHLLPDLSTFGV
ncbi:hypothetical protein AK812_SmicGene18923 [Symbiodinium microadriaticum]|uniref:Uncharacterized protein n=1 Tax=Symbiodinium microadriaticum TaxID=2951 RepID=A0A1Q9DTS0_SYMMI|nr:hypothetical protein AK812_SmicGene18923 [Symbiodinium microadriaticum]